MKNILSVFFLLISVSCYSMIDSDTIKIFPEINGIIKYEGVVNVDSAITKEQLFVNAKNWFVDTYKSANDVIQMQDKMISTCTKVLCRTLFVFVVGFVRMAAVATFAYKNLY